MKSCKIQFKFKSGSTIEASFAESTDYTNVVNELCRLFDTRCKLYKSDLSKFTKKSNILPVSRIDKMSFFYDGVEVDLSMSFKDISSGLLRSNESLLSVLTIAFGDFQTVLSGELSHLQLASQN